MLQAFSYPFALDASDVIRFLVAIAFLTNFFNARLFILFAIFAMVLLARGQLHADFVPRPTSPMPSINVPFP